MAATRLIALHVNKGHSVAKSLGDRTDYAKNPEKTEKGELVTAYGCDPITVDEEFMLQKRLYYQVTGRSQKEDVIAYQIRQSFKPGEITPEKANKLGRYSFIVATHTDRAHVHNHIIFNSTSMDGKRKFRDFRRSGITLQKISDLICLEHGLSVIEPVPYSERKKRTEFPQKINIREIICKNIDKVLSHKPKDFDAFLDELKNAGYEIKIGKNISVKDTDQKKFIRLASLPDGYRESDIRAILSGMRSSEDRSIAKPQVQYRTRSFNLVVDIQKKMKEKGPGYAHWATVYNLKQMSKTLLFLREHKIRNLDKLHSLASEKNKTRDELLVSIHKTEARLSEIAMLRKHIINYSNTRSTYEAYRKAFFSKNFFDAHREELTLNKAAKEAFDEL